MQLKSKTTQSTRFVYLNKEVWPTDLNKSAKDFLVEKLIRAIGAHELEVILKTKDHPLTQEFIKEKDLSLIGFGTGFFEWNKNLQGQLIDLKTSKHFIYILKTVARIGTKKDLKNIYGSYFLVDQEEPFLIGFNIKKELQAKDLILPVDQGIIIFPSCLIAASDQPEIKKDSFDNISLDSHLLLQPLRENHPELKEADLNQFESEEIFENLVYGSFFQLDPEKEISKLTAINKNLYLKSKQKDFLINVSQEEINFSW